MSTLGVYDGHNAGAAVIAKDGTILAAVEEERFSRVKNHDSRPGKQVGPHESVTYCLKQTAEPVTEVALGLADPDELHALAMRNFDRRIQRGESQRLDRARELGLSAEELRELPLRTQRERVEAILGIVRDAGVPNESAVAFIDHHAAHAGGAFFLSGVGEALVVTLDGKGDDLSGSVSIGRGASIERIAAMHTEESLGHLYSAFTVSCGLRPQRDEGKLQALAASGRPDASVRRWLDERFTFNQGTGTVVGRLNDGLVVGPYPDRLPHLHNSLIASVIAGVKPEDAAATVQEFLEEIVTELARWHLKSAGIRHLVVAGGVFANVGLNRQLSRLPEVDELHVHPAMTDAGIALGAAAVRMASQGIRPFPLTTAALGPEYDDETASAAFARAGYHIHRPTEKGRTAEAIIAKALAGGRVVARFFGRAEYGPRALGNRSILAPANDPAMPERLNRMLRRSTVMPFAPIVRAKHADELFDDHQALDGPLRFMTAAVMCSDLARQHYPAIVHLDGTARPQLVDEGPLEVVLEEYERHCGRRVLINTSFNLHDEPMVCRPEDAARTARTASIEVVQVGRIIASLG